MADMARKTNDAIGDAIRKAFKRSGQSILELSRKAGLGYATVHEFLNSPKMTLRTSSASKLMRVLGLKIHRK